MKAIMGLDRTTFSGTKTISKLLNEILKEL